LSGKPCSLRFLLIVVAKDEIFGSVAMTASDAPKNKHFRK